MLSLPLAEILAHLVHVVGEAQGGVDIPVRLLQTHPTLPLRAQAVDVVAVAILALDVGQVAPDVHQIVQPVVRLDLGPLVVALSRFWY